MAAVVKVKGRTAQEGWECLVEAELMCFVVIRSFANLTKSGAGLRSLNVTAEILDLFIPRR
jgi:hypothetical protein